jgi:T5SS/PEP-CTERM-associated repeat protein
MMSIMEAMESSRIRMWAVCVIVLCLSFPLSAEVVVDPAQNGATDVDTQDPAEMKIIGVTDRGTVRLTLGTQWTTESDITLGDEVDAVGVVEIQDGSRWVSNAYQDVKVGDKGRGIVDISNGELNLTNTYLTLGDDQGSQGTIVVGAQGRLSVSYPQTWSDVYLGKEGRGELQIVDGGYVTSSQTTWSLGKELSDVGVNDSYGYLLIDGVGSELQGGTSAIDVNQGDVMVRNGGELYAGNTWLDGRMTVTGAGSVLSLTDSTLIFETASTRIQGTLENPGELHVLDGGSLLTRAISVGDSGGGAMYLQGTGSTAHARTWVSVGAEEGTSGSLEISQGGVMHVEAGSLTVGRIGGVGSVLVTGVGSQMNVTGTSYLGKGEAEGELTYSDHAQGTHGGTMYLGSRLSGRDGRGALTVSGNSSVSITGNLWAGMVPMYYSVGTLTGNSITVTDGSSLDVQGYLMVGETIADECHVVSIGNESVLSVGEYFDHGTKTHQNQVIMDNGSLQVEGLLAVAMSAFSGTGQVTAGLVNDGYLDGTDVVYDNANPVNPAAEPIREIQHVNDEGVITLTVTGEIQVRQVYGYYDTASVTVSEDQHWITTGNIELGKEQGAQGTVNIVGANARWSTDAAEEVLLGGFEGGVGVVNVEGGSFSAGKLVLRGEGSTLRVSGSTATVEMTSLYLTNGGVYVTDGASVAPREEDTFTAGAAPGSNLSVLSVSGQGSSLRLPSSMGGSINIQVEDGGHLVTGDIEVDGVNAGIRVTGQGSVWDVDELLMGSLYPGLDAKDSGPTTAVISEGAVVNAERIVTKYCTTGQSGYPRTRPLLSITGPGTVVNAGSFTVNEESQVTVSDGAVVNCSQRSSVSGTDSNPWGNPITYLTITDQGTQWNGFDMTISAGSDVTVSDGAQVNLSDKLAMYSNSVLRIEVSNDDMIICDTMQVGIIPVHYGSASVLKMVAPRELAAGVYRPINIMSESSPTIYYVPDRGSIEAVGGVWNDEEMTFTVAAPVMAGRGETKTIDLLSQQRMMIGEDLEMVFAPTAVSTPMDVTVTAIEGEGLSGFRDQLADGEQFLTGYDFDLRTLPSGSSVQLAMQITPGLSVEQVQMWYEGEWSGWEAIVLDDFVIEDDWAIFTVNAFSAYAISTDGLISGDANKDGLVNVGDLGILSTYYGMESDATWEMGDFNGDGKVDVGDLGMLSTQYGMNADLQEMSLQLMESSEYATASVPEPTSLVLLVMGMAGMAKRRNRNRTSCR